MSQTSTPKTVWYRSTSLISISLAVVAAISGGLIWYAVGSASPGEEQQPGAVVRTQPVRVVQAKQQPIHSWVFAEGTARSYRREYLTFDRAGRVTYLKKATDGDDLRAGERVQAGEVLARLDPRQYDSEIDSARASVAEAKAQLAVAQNDISQAETQHVLAAAKHKRVADLMRQRASSLAEYEEAEANEKNAAGSVRAAQVKVQALEASVKAAEARLEQSLLTLDETTIRSPIDGVIAYLNIDEGIYFTPSNIRTTSETDALMTIPIVVIDPASFEITVDVPSYQAELLKIGQEVMLVPGGMSATAAFGESPAASTPSEIPWKAKGKVFSINPAVNPGGRSVQLKIRTSQGSEQLKDGMFVACWIQVMNKPDAVVAPFNAFLFEENRPHLFVVERGEGDTGIARRINVQIGIEGLDAREVVGGVQPNDWLVTDGRYRLVDGAPVRVVSDESEGESSSESAAVSVEPSPQ